jgi:bacterioferritin-associated ferredoxin
MEEVIDQIYTVCHCNEVTYKEIMDAIKAGACDLETLMDRTDAGTACGLCKSVEDDPAGERAIHLDELIEKAKLEEICPDNNE